MGRCSWDWCDWPAPSPGVGRESPQRNFKHLKRKSCPLLQQPTRGEGGRHKKSAATGMRDGAVDWSNSGQRGGACWLSAIGRVGVGLLRLTARFTRRRGKIERPDRAGREDQDDQNALDPARPANIGEQHRKHDRHRRSRKRQQANMSPAIIREALAGRNYRIHRCRPAGG